MWHIVVIPTIVYLVLIFVIGYYTKQKGLGDKVDGFFAADRKVHFSFLSTAIMAGLGIWAASYMAAAEGAYVYGLAGLWIYPLYFIGVAMPALGAGRLKKILPYGTTIYQFAKLRFDAKTQILWIILFAIFSIMNIVLQITGTGVAFSALTDGVVPYWLGAAVACVLIILYLFYAGLWQSIITEFFLVILVIIGLAAIVISVTGQLGGIYNIADSFMARVVAEGTPEMANLFRSDALRDYLFPVLTWSFLVIWARQELWQIVFAGDQRSIKQSYVFTGVWWAAVPMVCAIIGLAGWATYVDVARADDIFPTMVSMYVPLGGILLVFLIIQGVVSTSGQITIGTASIAINDIYIEYFNPKLKEADVTEDRKIRKYARIAIISIVVLATIVTLGRISMLFLLLSLNLLLAPVAMPLLLGMFSKAINTNGAFWGSLLGVLSGLISLFALDLGTGFSLIIGVALSLIITVVASVFKPANFNFEELPEKAIPLGSRGEEIVGKAIEE